jgi:hypothetical protein
VKLNLTSIRNAATENVRFDPDTALACSKITVSEKENLSVTELPNSTLSGQL